MAESKYLDGGGLTHLWSKIKAYYDAYLVTWKTSNFGTGTYNNSGKLYAESGAIVEVLDSSRITLESNSLFDLNNTQIDGDASSLSMNEFDLTVNNAEISYENCSVEISSSTVSNYNLKKASGIAVIKNNDRIQITNISGSRIMIGYVFIQYEDSSRFDASISNYILNNSMSVKLGNSVYSYFLMLLFWNTY